MGEWAVPVDSAAGRRIFSAQMESQRGGERDQEYKLLRRGWFFGNGRLKEQLLERMGTAMGRHHGGHEKFETDMQKAERVVARELKKRGWTEEDLEGRRKTDAVKVRMAARLRAETVMTMDWIARRLRMGCRHTVANCLKKK